MPISAAKPITVPNTAWNALAPVIGALVRTTLSVANSTEAVFDLEHATEHGASSPAASRRLFWKVTERMLRLRTRP